MDDDSNEKLAEDRKLVESPVIPKQRRSWKKFFGLFILGQVVAFLNSTSGLASQFLVSNYQANIPCTQMLLTYGLLAMIYLPWLIYSKRYQDLVKTKRWIFYAILALLDFEAGYLIVKAFQYTTIVSVMLLDCFTIPVVMTLSFLLLRVRYRWLHFLGIGFCFAGIVILVLNDILHQTAFSGTKPWLGDILVVAAATCYALTNVGQEAMVKHFSAVEFLSMLGFFGSLYSSIQLSLLEIKAINDMDWTGSVLGILFGFSLTLFVFYSLSPWLFYWSNVTFYNLSLLASDVYGLIYGVLIFHIPVRKSLGEHSIVWKHLKSFLVSFFFLDVMDVYLVLCNYYRRNISI